MTIQGIGRSFAGYQPVLNKTQGMSTGIDPPHPDQTIAMGKADNNLDGVLSPDESGLPGHLFEKADSDSDGQLTNEEFENMLSNSPPMMGGGIGGGIGGSLGSILDSMMVQVLEDISNTMDSLTGNLEQVGHIDPEEQHAETQNIQTTTRDMAENAYSQAMNPLMNSEPFTGTIV